LKLAKTRDIPPFIVMEIMKEAAAREAAGGDVLHMEVGQPSTSAPKGVIQAAKDALDREVLGYTLALGIPELRQAIADYYKSDYGVQIPMERVAITTGSSGAFLLSFLAAFDPGDKVAILRPGYPCYRNILSALGIDAVDVPVGPDSRFQPTIEHLERAGGRDLDGLLLASPANPTGSMLQDDEFEMLLAYCRDRDIRYISDEIYHGITYGRRARSALEFTGQAAQDPIIINSFSKYFSMTGWRLGWMVLPEDMVEPVERLAQNMFISAPSLSQVAAIAAFNCRDELNQNVLRYSANRDLLLDRFPAAGLDKMAPADGAFYIYADVREFTNDSEVFAREMMQATGVAATPGLDFDPVDGRAYMRFSFAGVTHDMAEAANRLTNWLND
jgi:aspartate/methionine/tyrosine aminotransferase